MSEERCVTLDWPFHVFRCAFRSRGAHTLVMDDFREVRLVSMSAGVSSATPEAWCNRLLRDHALLAPMHALHAYHLLVSPAAIVSLFLYQRRLFR